MMDEYLVEASGNEISPYDPAYPVELLSHCSIDSRGRTKGAVWFIPNANN